MYLALVSMISRNVSLGRSSQMAEKRQFLVKHSVTDGYCSLRFLHLAGNQRKVKSCRESLSRWKQYSSVLSPKRSRYQWNM